jgi:predicted NBD/HSP70 family sugar kinase
MAKKEVAVGIDIGGTNTVFGFVDREGNILGEDKLKTTHYDEIEVFVAALYEKIQVTGQKIGNGTEVIGILIRELLNMPQAFPGKVLFLSQRFLTGIQNFR